MAGLEMDDGDKVWEYRKSFAESPVDEEKSESLPVTEGTNNGKSAEPGVADSPKLGQPGLHSCNSSITMPSDGGKDRSRTPSTGSGKDAGQEGSVKRSCSAVSLLSEADRQGSTISYHNITYSVDTKARCGCGAKTKQNILKDVR